MTALPSLSAPFSSFSSIERARSLAMIRSVTRAQPGGGTKRVPLIVAVRSLPAMPTVLMPRGLVDESGAWGAGSARRRHGPRQEPLDIRGGNGLGEMESLGVATAE